MESRETKDRRSKFASYKTVYESRFEEAGDCWHVLSDGENTENIFITDTDFIVGMNIMALCGDRFRDRVKIYTFELMINHIHLILSGKIEDCKEFYGMFKRKLLRYISNSGRNLKAKKLDVDYKHITDLRYMRTAIAYVNRNGYKRNKPYTPFSYPWGANNCFFNPMHRLLADGYAKDLSPSNREAQLKSKDVTVSDYLTYMKVSYKDGKCVEFAQTDMSVALSYENKEMSKPNTVDKIFLPNSYCRIEEAERFYVNAHDYLRYMTKDVEGQVLMAEESNDSEIFTEEEINSRLYSQMKERYDTMKLNSLSMTQKKELAKMLHYEMKCSNAEIRRAMDIKIETLNSWFPMAK